MKALKALSFLGLGISLVFTSCTVEKRVASRGYHIEWKGNNKFVKPEAAASEDVAVIKEKKTVIRTEKNEAAAEVFAYVPVENAAVVTSDAPAATEKTTEVSAPAAVKATTKSATVVSEKKATDSKTTVSKAEVKKAVKEMKKQSRGSDVPKGLLYVLCFFIPWLAVGLVTDWDVKTIVINLLWTLLCGIPGIIHAIIVVSREY